MADGWHRMPNLVTERISEIGVTAYAVYGVLGLHADSEGACWPSVARIGLIVGVTARTIRTHLRTLEKAGLIRIESRKHSNGNLTNVYHMITPQLPPEASFSPTETDDTPTEASFRRVRKPASSPPGSQLPPEQDSVEQDLLNKTQGTREGVRTEPFKGKLINGFDTPEVREGLGRWFFAAANHPTSPKRFFDFEVAAVGLCQQCGSAESLVAAINQAIGGAWANLRPEAGADDTETKRNLHFPAENNQ